MDEEEFEKYVSEAIAALPAKYRERLDNVEFFVTDHPTPEQVAKLRLRGGTLLLGLYEGIPQTHRGNYGVGMTLPDRISIFRYPILLIAHTREHAIALIQDTVKHEIAHHFGLSDEAIHEGKRKRQRSG
jgi:predicted Zn-dependent protease with MMP-like domain